MIDTNLKELCGKNKTRERKAINPGSENKRSQDVEVCRSEETKPL